MSNIDPSRYDYDPNNLDGWLSEPPTELLRDGLSEVRVNNEYFFAMGFGSPEDDRIVLKAIDVTFSKRPGLTFKQLRAKIAQCVLARVYLTRIWRDYYYKNKQNILNTNWKVPENFEIQIDITENFDARAYVNEHPLPPLSLLLAISKELIAYTEKVDTYLRLLAEPHVLNLIYFPIVTSTGDRKDIPLSKRIDDLMNVNNTIMRVGQTGVAYVNVKRSDL